MTSSAEVRMIDAAERLVAEGGLGAMSLRAVQAAAGQRNKSAAQYHFGSRDGLIEAIIARRMAPINTRRRQLLDALPAEPSVSQLVDALVRPSAEAVLTNRPSRWARFVLAGIVDPTVAHVVRRNVEGESFRDASARIHLALEPLPERIRHRRVEQALGLTFVSLAAMEAGGAPDDPELAVRDLVAVATAVVVTPPPA